MKTCNNKVCTQVNPQPLDNFFKDKNNKTDGHYSICKDCKKKSTYKWRDANKDKYNESQRTFQRGYTSEERYGHEIKRRYGCTLEQYNVMLTAQAGACAICKCLHNPAVKKGRLFVDHCHKTGAVRALLCSGCNSLLGYAKDDSRILLEAVAYLGRHKKTQV